MNLKQKIKNVTEFSKHHPFKSFEDSRFVRHTYLAYGYLRHKDFTLMEDPKRSKKPINVVLLSFLINVLSERQEDISQRALYFDKILKEKGYKTEGLTSQNTLRPVYISKLLSNNPMNLTRFGKLITSEKDISAYIDGWDKVSSLIDKNKDLSWWRLNSVSEIVSQKLDTVMPFNNLVLQDNAINWTFSVGKENYSIQIELDSKKSKTSLSIENNELKTIKEVLSESNTYDFLSKLRSSSILDKINDFSAIIKRRILNTKEDITLNKEEIIQKLIPALDKMGYFVEFSFSENKVLCQIVSKKLYSGIGSIKYRVEGGDSMESSFINALKLMIEKQQLWEIV